MPSAIGELSNLEVLELGSWLFLIVLPSLYDLKDLKELELIICEQLKCLPHSLGDLRNLKKLRIVLEMFVNFYVGLVEWVEYSMFSTHIRITIIPTIFNNVNLYELMWPDKGWSLWSERGTWSINTWKLHNRFLSCFRSQVVLANGLSL